MKCNYRYVKSEEINTVQLGTTEDIKLFNSINMEMGKISTNTSYSIQDIEVDNGIKYIINTKYPDTIPNELVTMLFNLDLDLNVSCVELPFNNPFIRSYEIMIEKY